MAESVESVVLKLEAQVGDYNAQVAGAANVTERSLAKIQSSATQGGKALSVFGGAGRIAANDAAAGFNVLTNAAHGNTVAMRESLVVARELAVGNFTRLPGSLSILAQQFAISGKSGLGFAAQILQAFGIVKKSVDAGAAAEAAAAEGAAASLRTVLQKAEANIAAADTESALARAQLVVATTSTEEAAAQARLAAAQTAMATSAGEASIAQVALAEAEGRAATASAAAAATVTTSLGALAVVIGIVAVPLGLLFAAFKQFQSQVKDSGELTRYRDSLGLTHSEMLKLSDGTDQVSKKIKGLTDVTVTAGDVMAGLWETIEQGASGSAGAKGWEALKGYALDAFDAIVSAWAVVSASITAGIYGTANAGKIIWNNFASSVGDVFYQATNIAINAMNDLVKAGTAILNGFIHAANNVPFVKIGDVSAPQISGVSNPYAGANSQKNADDAAKAIGDGYRKAYADAKKSDADFWAQVSKNSRQHEKDRMKAEADALKDDRSPKKAKKVSDHGLAESEAELDAQIAGQWKLAAAYQVSDAAVIKAEALQKAEEQAIRHKGETGVFYEKELALAVAQGAAAGAKVIADLNAQAVAHKQVNDLVAAGLLPVGEMTTALNTETEKRGLLARLAIAEEKGWIDKIKELKAEIAGLTTAQADLNTQLAREQVLRDTAADNQAIDRLKLEASLMGASNRERAVALAQFDAIQQLKNTAGSADLPASEKLDFINHEVGKAMAAYQSPLQQWMAETSADADKMREMLEGAAVDGFGALTDGITAAITGTKSLGAAFHDIAGQIIADLVRIAVQQEIVGPLAKALFPNYSGGGGGGILGSLAGLFGGGSGVKVAAPFSLSSVAGFRASGGPVAAGMPYVVGEQGKETFVPTTPGMIVPNQRLGAASSGAPSVVRIEVAEGQLFEPRVTQISGQVSVQVVKTAAPTLIDASANETARRFGRPKM